MTVHTKYRWEKTIAEVKLNRRPTPIHYTDVRDVIGKLKKMLKTESDPDVRKALSKAGIELSKILLK